MALEIPDLAESSSNGLLFSLEKRKVSKLLGPKNISNIAVSPTKSMILYKMTKTVKEYFEILNKEKEEFGRKICLFYQMGAFFEVYDIETTDGTLGEIDKLLDIMNIAKAVKNIGKQTQHFMGGFGIEKLNKYKRKLTAKNYTVTLLRQKWKDQNGQEIDYNPNDGSKPYRRITERYGPGTDMDTANSGINNLMFIYLDNTEDILCAGISVIDLITGKNKIIEVINSDENNVIDEVTRICLSEIPKEIVIYKISWSYDVDQLKHRLNITDKMVHVHEKVDKNVIKIKYQNELLSRVFKYHGAISPIQYLGLERMPSGSLCYSLMLDYVYKHNELVLKDIEKPRLIKESEYLRLDKNSILQLNIISDKNEDFLENKSSSLFGILNHTCTALGKRLLMERILHPIVNDKVLQWRYDQVEKLGRSESQANLLKLLKGVPDIERLQRRLSLGTLHPASFITIDQAYKNIISLFEDISVKPIIEKIDKDIKTKLQQLVVEYNSVLDLEQMNINMNNINISFFKAGTFDRIDKIQNLIKIYHQYIDVFKDTLSTIVPINKKYTGGRYYLLTTNHRSKTLIPSLASQTKNIVIGQLNIDPKRIRCERKTSSNKMIICDQIEPIIDTVVNLEEKMKNEAKSSYINYQMSFYSRHEKTMSIIVEIISEIDFLLSGAVVAKRNKYVKPTIVQKDNSFLDIKDLRHPILERIRQDEQYVPNDVKLNDDTSGLIITGVNGVGKSALLKSIGLIIVAAQMGYFVSCSIMIYNPFKLLMTRILGNDNMLLGESSFMVEMIETKMITQRGNAKSLILVDELCRGTGHVDSLSLVSSTINYITTELNARFVVTTHLHKIFERTEITNLKTIKIKHMKVDFITDPINSDSKKIVYNRKLEDGICPPHYGIEIARHLGLPSKLISMAESIRKDLLLQSQSLISSKRSRYNVNLEMRECQICGLQNVAENLDTHHILEQCKADANGFFKDATFVQGRGNPLHKNDLHNLVCLCKACHRKVHQKKIKIDGYKQTDQGIKLIFNHIDEE